MAPTCLDIPSLPLPLHRSQARLRWNADLHERFVDAVTQHCGPDKATTKTIIRTMGVKGLTLCHLKSHFKVISDINKGSNCGYYM